MSKFVIRKATENDAESLLKIYEPYITNTTITFEYEVPTAEAFADRRLRFRISSASVTA